MQDFVYSYANVLVQSELHLPELRTVGHPTRQSDLHISVLGQAEMQAATDEVKFAQFTSDVVSVGRTKSGFLLNFADVAAFLIGANGERIQVWAAPGSAAELVRHLLVDQVLPKVLALRHQLVLHGATIGHGSCAVCFIGPSGRGKSTLAASFYAVGCRLLSDDGVVLAPSEQELLAWPLYASLRLWPASVDKIFTETPVVAAMAPDSTKRRIVLPESIAHPITGIAVKSIFVIESEQDEMRNSVEIKELSQREACISVLRNAFRLDPSNRDHIERILLTTGQVVSRVPVFSVQYPRDFAMLPQVRAAILNVCSQ